MPRDARLVLDNACYHIITRGNQRQKVFMEEVDLGEYLIRLKRYKRRYSFKLYGYCLMPNHVHIVGQTKKTINLAKFMQTINNSYTSYYNFKYGKVGHLWQGRFMSKIISKDRYLLDCITYIETNPVRANMVGVPHEYRHSSYIERNMGLDGREGVLDDISL